MRPQDLKRVLAPIRHRVQMMVARAVVSLVDDAKGIQSLQLSGVADELIEDAERMENYGFTSHPHPAAEAVVVFPGGLRSHALIVAVGDRRYRVKAMQAGEVAVYDDQGQQVRLGRDGLRIVSALKIEIEAPEVTVTAATRVTVLCPEINLGGEGGQLVARHDDAVVGGKVVATTTKVRAL